jgi:heme oxygenase
MDNFSEILKDQAIFNAELERSYQNRLLLHLLPLTLSRYLMSEQEVASKQKIHHIPRE